MRHHHHHHHSKHRHLADTVAITLTVLVILIVVLILAVCGSALLCSCTKAGMTPERAGGGPLSCTVTVECADLPGEDTRSVFSESSLKRVSDVNIYIYREGSLVWSRYFPSTSGIQVSFPDAEAAYDIYMLANVGQKTAPPDEEDISTMVYSFSDYGPFEQNGFPMAEVWHDYRPGSSLVFRLRRLVGMYSIRMENSSDVVDYRILSLEMRNCARDIYPFGDAPATQFLEIGDMLCGADLDKINAGEAVPLYFLENRQGKLLPDNTDPKQKIPDNLPDRTVAGRCTYLQLTADVTTPTAHYEGVRYRLYLGQDMCSDFSIIRNTLYNLTLNFSRNLISYEGWRVEPDTPDILGTIALSKTEAGVIAGVDDVVYVRTFSANGSPLDFDVIPDEDDARAQGLSYTTIPVTWQGHPATAVRFSTSRPVDGLQRWDEYADEWSTPVHVKIQSRDLYNGEPTVTRDVSVRVYHKAFPIWIRAVQDGYGGTGTWSLYACCDNPLRLGFRISLRTYSGQGEDVIRSNSGAFRRFSIDDTFFATDPDTPWSIEDNTLNRNGRRIGSIGRLEEYSGGIHIELNVEPETERTFRTPYSNEVALEYPKFTVPSLYMGRGTTAFFGPGNSLAPGRFQPFPDDCNYELQFSGHPDTSTHKGVRAIWVTSAGLFFHLSEDTTGWNRQEDYSPEAFLGSPFYFVNGGQTVYDFTFRCDEPRYLNKSARNGFIFNAYEPGRDLGIVSPDHATFGALIGTMTQFFGNNHTWEHWKRYDYHVYMTINGCSCWPGADASPEGFSPSR